MDLKIQKPNKESVMLSYFGLYKIEIDVGQIEPTIENRSIRGRSGFVHDRITYKSRRIKVNSRIRCSNMLDFENKRVELSGLLFDEPYKISCMLPNKTELYGFEMPGETTGEFKLPELTELGYHWIVTATSLEFEHKGTSKAGIIFDVEIEFQTTELPFGTTDKKRFNDIARVPPLIEGTADVSQLEQPFMVELIPNGSNTKFYIEIDGRRFIYEYTATPFSSGKMLLNGIETVLNGEVVNTRTNYQYFILKAGKNISVKSDFKGTINLVDVQFLYK